MTPAKDETGKRFRKLTVVSRAGTHGTAAAWLCKCDCGGEKVVTGAHLRRGVVRSCGCLPAGRPPRPNNRCYQGHEVVGANRQELSSGYTACKICARATTRAYYYRIRNKV